MTGVIDNTKTFQTINEVYEDRDKRVRELKKEGKKIIGYLCCFVPVEMLTALDLVPYRIRGCISEPITHADSYLESVSCPFIRSCLDQALKNRFDFLDGIIIPHTCDTVHRIYDIWRHYIPTEYHYFLNVPHMTEESSKRFFQKELESLKKSLENYTGRALSSENLLSSIHLHNKNRLFLKELYSFRKYHPPLISGSESLKTVMAGMGMTVSEHNDLLSELILKLKKHTVGKSANNLPRLLVYGSEIDDVSILKLIEDCGSEIVMDDLCTGSRGFFSVINTTSEPLQDLANHYLIDINCPRTYRQKAETRTKDLRNRFHYLLDYIRDYDVKGVVLYNIRYCDTFELEAPDIKELMQEENIPVLYLEDDYAQSATGQIKTRVQAFLEMLG